MLLELYMLGQLIHINLCKFSRLYLIILLNTLCIYRLEIIDSVKSHADLRREAISTVLFRNGKISGNLPVFSGILSVFCMLPH